MALGKGGWGWVAPQALSLQTNAFNIDPCGWNILRPQSFSQHPQKAKVGLMFVRGLVHGRLFIPTRRSLWGGIYPYIRCLCETTRVQRVSKQVVRQIKKDMDLSALALRDVQVSVKGAKSCQLITTPTNGKVQLTLGSKAEPLRSPFGATTFGDEEATRKRLVRRG